MSAWRKHLPNFLILSLLGFFLYTRGPTILSLFKMQGISPGVKVVQTLDGEEIQLPMNQSHVLIFWATWCPPCSVELGRIQKMIQSGDLDPKKVIAVSMGEELQVVQRHAKQKGYTFPIAIDRGPLAQEYKVNATPTLFLFDENQKVAWATTGISPSLEVRLGQLK